MLDHRWIALTASLTILVALDSTRAEQAEAAPTESQRAFFETSIRPLLIEHCLDCHSGDDPESGLNMESRAGLLRGGELGPAIVPGDPKTSLLVTAISHSEYLKMPPKDKLSTAELVDISQWVEMGAPWPSEGSDHPQPVDFESTDEDPSFTAEQQDYWAFQTPQRPPPPPVRDIGWIRSPIDRFVLSKLEQASIVPAQPADKRTLLRRATYDLTGLPPTNAQIESFLADQSPSAFASVVDQLLASPRYGEHWGRHWLDVARYADSNGLDENIAYANAFRYRDYVIAAFNNDKPYDRFVQEQIAGDLLDDSDDLDRYVATGFLAIGAKMLAEDDPVKMQMDIIDEQLNTLCQAFMGLTIGCARCHDHKFDPLPTADYYSLAGIFKSSKTMNNHNVVAKWFERPLVDAATAERIDRTQEEISALNKSIDKIHRKANSKAVKEIRSRVADYLLAVNALDQVERQIDAGRGTASESIETPHAVAHGYALIEAEAFHRGDIERTSVGYGNGIGVILSRGAGFVEYDLEVSHPGTYSLELRYAAAVGRPFDLLVNGDRVATIANSVTGDWNPPGQSWFIETELTLGAGINQIRFQSSGVYPHVDRFALVLADQTWPFESDPPPSLTHATLAPGLKTETVRQWRTYLSGNGGLPDEGPHPFQVWKDWNATPPGSNSNSIGGSATPNVNADPPPNRVAAELMKIAPPTLDQAAAAYQSIVDRASDEPELANLLFVQGSPLNGPIQIDPYLSQAARDQIRDQSNRRVELEQSLPKPDYAMGVTEGTPQDLQVHLRGSHITLGKTVPRRFPQILTSVTRPPLSNTGSGRLAFAQWLTDPDHPLTARVIVNRLWHWHFGRGIVASVDNFGALGDRPTHPELLDWLAVELVSSDWSLKRMHRAMMLSSTYQMSTEEHSVGVQTDPENELIWRMNRRRLTAEEIRDSIVMIGQGMDAQMGGTLLKTANHAYVNSTGSAIGAAGYENQRRTVYLPVIRSSVYDVMQTLDFPDPAVTNGRRQTSTVAPQALLMMNSDLVDRNSLQCASETMASFAGTEQRIAAIYQRVFGRRPNARELEQATLFIDKGAEVGDETSVWQSLCRALISTNEFVYVE